MSFIINRGFILGLSYLLFLVSSLIAWRKGIISLSDKAGFIGPLTGINIKNISGIILLGLPLIIYRSEWLHLFARPSSDLPMQELTSSLLVPSVCFIAISSVLKKNLVDSSGENSRIDFRMSAIVIYLFIRIFFLVIYECFFRGLLLIACVDSFDIAGAIVINLIFYVVGHVFSDRMEMLACIPFGIILCSITLWWQSVVPAIILHLLLALVHEIYLFRNQIIITKSIQP